MQRKHLPRVSKTILRHSSSVNRQGSTGLSFFTQKSFVCQTVIGFTVRAAKKGSIHAIKIAFFNQLLQCLLFPQMVSGIIHSFFHLLQNFIRHLKFPDLCCYKSAATSRPLPGAFRNPPVLLVVADLPPTFTSKLPASILFYPDAAPAGCGFRNSPITGLPAGADSG